jgi:hypothetical protein
MPPLNRQPEYRKQRSHKDFLISFKDAGVCNESHELSNAIQKVLTQCEFSH